MAHVVSVGKISNGSKSTTTTPMAVNSLTPSFLPQMPNTHSQTKNSMTPLASTTSKPDGTTQILAGSLVRILRSWMTVFLKSSQIPNPLTSTPTHVTTLSTWWTRVGSLPFWQRFQLLTMLMLLS